MAISIKCHGAYYYRTDNQKGIKEYAIEVFAPSLEYFHETSRKYTGTDDNGVKQFAERSYLNVRGRLKKQLLPILLQRKHADFARVRYVVIDEIIGEGLHDLPVQLQSKEQLRKVVSDERIPVNVDEYLEIDELRTDILEYREDASSWLRDKSRRDKRRMEEREFIRLNSLEPTTSVPPQKSIGSIIDL